MYDKIYIAGPMTGYPNFNFEAFDFAEAFLKSEGWQTVFNPASEANQANASIDEAAKANGDGKGVDFKAAYAWDVSKVIEADAIYMLEGWEYSPGAIGEHAVAVAMKRHYPEYAILYE